MKFGIKKCGVIIMNSGKTQNTITKWWKDKRDRRRWKEILGDIGV